MDQQERATNEDKRTIIEGVKRNLEHDIDAVLESVFDDPRIVMSSKLRITRGLRNLRIDKPAGVFRGSTKELTDVVGMSPEKFAANLNALKGDGVLLQCGRGRGKCIVLMTDVIEGEARQEEVRQTAKTLSKDEALTQLALKKREVERLQEQVTQLRTANVKREEEVEELKRKLLDNTNNFTWS